MEQGVSGVVEWNASLWNAPDTSEALTHFPDLGSLGKSSRVESSERKRYLLHLVHASAMEFGGFSFHFSSLLFLFGP